MKISILTTLLMTATTSSDSNKKKQGICGFDIDLMRDYSIRLSGAIDSNYESIENESTESKDHKNDGTIASIIPRNKFYELYQENEQFSPIDNTCSICFEKLITENDDPSEKLVILTHEDARENPHCYHFSCFNGWMKEKRSCVVCRRRFKMNKKFLKKLQEEVLSPLMESEESEDIDIIEINNTDDNDYNMDVDDENNDYDVDVEMNENNGIDNNHVDVNDNNHIGINENNHIGVNMNEKIVNNVLSCFLYTFELSNIQNAISFLLNEKITAEILAEAKNIYSETIPEENNKKHKDSLQILIVMAQFKRNLELGEFVICNLLTDDLLIKKIAEIVNKMDGLRLLDISKNSKISQESIKLILDAVDSSKLESLKISDVKIEESTLIETLKKLTNLRSLDISNTGMTQNGLLSVLDGLTNLENLHISGNDINVYGLSEIAAKLEKFRNLMELEFSIPSFLEKDILEETKTTVGIYVYDFNEMINRLIKISNLEVLGLSFDGLSESKAELVAGGLMKFYETRKSDKLVMKIQYKNINIPGFEKIIQAMKTIDRWEFLDFCFSFKNFTEAIRTLKFLEDLKGDVNLKLQFDDEILYDRRSAYLMGNTIKKIPFLRELKIEGIRHLDFLKNLVFKLGELQKLELLDISECKVDYSIVDYITMPLATFPKLEFLILNNRLYSKRINSLGSGSIRIVYLFN